MALIREFKEEFHLDITIVHIVRAFSYTKNDLHTIGITYEVACDDLPATIYIDPADNEALVWVDEKDFRNYTRSNNTSDHDEVTLQHFFSKQN